MLDELPRGAVVTVEFEKVSLIATTPDPEVTDPLLRVTPPTLFDPVPVFEMLPFDATVRTFVLVAVLRKIQDWLEDWNVVEPVVESTWKPAEVIYEPYPEDVEKVPAGTLMLK